MKPPPPSTWTPTKVLQANLQHSVAATAQLRRCLEGLPTAVALLQEPWTGSGHIRGLSNTKGKLYYSTMHAIPRACILTTNNICAQQLTEFCSRDLCAIKLQVPMPTGCRDLVLVSAYMPGEDEPPPLELQRLVSHCERTGLAIIIGADSNAHHPLWGMETSNNRGATDSPLCRGCMETEETAAHVVLECSGVAPYRAKYLGSPRDLPEVLLNIKGLVGFLEELGWQD
ncbi:uncharacterized protein LOC125240780 isoform X2 [Leguminivora glycinivorella]|uniref:uncharacterized protein LOC125229749 isoform X1 n=1 Tax=Leguminivora glycinivorella TaxID=1035111 RepID=UPI00200EDBA0|nr:uncharacterized protein LOC125229749 isoform X1 [Leguminivora glycinivorella]XP_047997451.1 uncharacterized protein LOC125235031 isoform X1 [Leguminivora glycinivorella]XP_048004811.1 uncharacterized protein LOC125240780 isoform X2 [Leguminivora glycinivorella]